MDCLLGADFLKGHSAVMDCRTSTLSIEKESRHSVLIFMGRQQVKSDSVPVIAPVDMEIPGRTIQLIQGELQGECDSFCEALVEPTSGAPPMNLCIARTLTRVQSGKEVVLQVMNISPTPVTIYKGMKLGEATPSHNIFVVHDNAREVAATQRSQLQTPHFNIDITDLKASEKRQLQDLLVQFADLFAPKGGPVGRTPNVKHSISTEGPPPLRRIPEVFKGVFDAEMTKMLEQGVVTPSISPWSSPIVIVKKKDGFWHFCVDYRKLNSVTHQDAYPLPRIDATLACATYFTTLDLTSGYWQVEVDEQDEEKTASSTPKCHFDFNVMPFCLTNAPATFQRLMGCVLAGLTEEQCLIYLDDMVVFSKTFEENIERLGNVFRALPQAGLTLRLSKCDIARPEVKFLGHIVSAAGVCLDPTKIKAVSTYPVPNSVKELRQFLGPTNYYHWFVVEYSKIVGPLHKP